MSSVLVDLREAVAAELDRRQRGEWSLPFVTEQGFQPIKNLDELDSQVYVAVVGRAQAGVSESRKQDRFTVQVDVGVKQKLVANTGLPNRNIEQQCDELMGLVQEVIDFFRQRGARPLEDYPTASLLSWTNDPAYAPEFLEEHGSFLSVLTLNFAVWLDKPDRS